MTRRVKRILRIVIIILLFFGVLLLANSLVITHENEYKLIKRFGRVDYVISEPGISLKTPFIQVAESLPKDIQFYDMRESDVITMDKKAMVVDSFSLWRIEDARLFAQTLNSSVVLAHSRIDTIVYNSLKNIISSKPQNIVISGRHHELSNAIMENIGDTMKQYGIDLITVELIHLDLPADNKNAVFERMISERAQMAATYIAEGESEAQIIRNGTDREVTIAISEAETEAARIRAQGEAEYMKILANAYSNQSKSEFYTFIRALEAAKNSLKGDDKTLILSEDSPIAQIFYNVE